MAAHKINDNTFDTFEIIGNGQTWHVSKTGSIANSTLTGISEDENSTDNVITVAGQVYAREGASLDGNATQISVTATGVIGGISVGIETTGVEDKISNAGIITAVGNQGIFSLGDKTSVHNSGEVFGTTAVEMVGTQLHFVNEETGLVQGTRNALLIASNTNATASIINHGKMVASGLDAFAVSGGLGNDTLINDGHIVGSISLGDGNDTFDLRDGKVDGKLFSGNGDDTLITDTQDYKLIEDIDEGVDTVKSTVTYRLSTNVDDLTLIGKANTSGFGNSGSNHLTGNVGNNALHGGDGIDVLDGGRGGDRLFGDAGMDIFTFATNDGHDTIEDLQPGSDLIFLGFWKAVQSFAEVRSHAHDHAEDVVIEAGHDSLTIHGFHKADLSASEFVFSF